MATDVQVFIDMTDVPEGVYQRVPQVEIMVQGLLVQSVLPESIEVVLVTDPNAKPFFREWMEFFRL